MRFSPTMQPWSCLWFPFDPCQFASLGGFFDPATELNMPAATEADFGETLAVWGVREGAYVETPIFGPSTERAYAGRWVDLFTNPLRYVLESPESYIPPSASVSASIRKGCLTRCPPRRRIPGRCAPCALCPVRWRRLRPTTATRRGAPPT